MTLPSPGLARRQYRLSIYAETPKRVVEGELFEIVYEVKNIGKNRFPGGIIQVLVSWASLGPHVTVIHDIEIKEPLDPDETFEFKVEETPLADGYTMFQPEMMRNQVMLPVGDILLFLRDGRRIVGNMIFGAVRARSHEEIFQEEAVIVARKTLNWALIALVFTACIGLVELLLEILKP